MKDLFDWRMLVWKPNFLGDTPVKRFPRRRTPSKRLPKKNVGKGRPFKEGLEEGIGNWNSFFKEGNS